MQDRDMQDRETCKVETCAEGATGPMGRARRMERQYQQVIPYYHNKILYEIYIFEYL